MDRIKVYEGLGRVAYITDKPMPPEFELVREFDTTADAEEWVYETPFYDTMQLDVALRSESRYVINDKDAEWYCFDYFEYL